MHAANLNNNVLGVKESVLAFDFGQNTFKGAILPLAYPQ